MPRTIDKARRPQAPNPSEGGNPPLPPMPSPSPTSDGLDFEEEEEEEEEDDEGDGKEAVVERGKGEKEGAESEKSYGHPYFPSPALR